MKKILCYCGCTKKKRNNKKSSTCQTEATELKDRVKGKGKGMDSFDQKKNEQQSNAGSSSRKDNDALKESSPITKVSSNSNKMIDEREKVSVNNQQSKTEVIIVNDIGKEHNINGNGYSINNNNNNASSSVAVENKTSDTRALNPIVSPVIEKKTDSVKSNNDDGVKNKVQVKVEIEDNASYKPMIVQPNANANANANGNSNGKDKEEPQEDENEKWLIPPDSRLICPYEKGIIEFSPNGLGRFLESLDKLTYAPLYNKNHLEINIRREGSPLNSKCFLFRSIYTQKKSELGENSNVPNIVRLMYRIEDRKLWDPTLKLLKKYEGDEKTFVVRTWCHSLVFFISEREGIEKRMLFTYKGVPIVLSTSVNDDYIPEEKGVVRITNYINAIKMEEDEENFYFVCYNQHDFKMPIPQWILNITLPTTTANWFVNFQKTALKTNLEPILFDIMP